MDCISPIISATVGCLRGLIMQHVKIAFSCKDYVTIMAKEMENLDDTSEGVKEHKITNELHDLEIPRKVPEWLDEVAKIKDEAKRIKSTKYAFFDMIARHQVGCNALETTQKIKDLLEKHGKISWTDAQKPLARVYSSKASTSASSGGKIESDFKSREKTFNEALEYLKPDHEIQVIALCGMGGVGKTTMMEQLKKVVGDTNMFRYIVKVVIGKEPHLFEIQKAIAENLTTPLKETIESTRAERLREIFKHHSEKAEKGILVIFDDVWAEFNLKDVGLNPLPKNIKLLLTSRYESKCKKIAVQGNLAFQVVRVNALEKAEACELLCQIAGVSKEKCPELYVIGEEIAKMCGGLPLAISVIAATLKDEEETTWRYRLNRLKSFGLFGDVDVGEDVTKIIKISYECLKLEEAKEMLLLCGLFHEDSDIPVEDLTRYAWGLRLFKQGPTVGDARVGTKACLDDLKKAYMLVDSDYGGCLKMHDIVHEFVNNTISKENYASIIEHGNMSSWSRVETNEICQRISLTCKGMKELPECFKCPNLTLLKLMHGSGKQFPEGFFGNMEKLQVIAYERMENVLLPMSLQCSTSLRVLCLCECSLEFDISFIGDLRNLEVLSLVRCSIRKLPSTFGKLKKLQLLDVTGCVDLCIDDGVLTKLHELKELYMTAADKKGITLTLANGDELAECSENLVALEIEFVGKAVLPKKMSFKKLDRFKISFGCYLEGGSCLDRHSLENTLMLVAKKCELSNSKMYELVEKANVLDLRVDDINDLGDGLMGSLHLHQSSFCKLRVLSIHSCANLRHLFHSKGSRVEVIKFQALKFLSLKRLPKLVSLCDNVNAIELPELEELELDGLQNFTSIFPSFKSNDVLPFRNHECNHMDVRSWSICQNFRSIKVSNCHALLYVIPSHAIVPKLEVLEISHCGSMKEIFEMRGVKTDVGYDTNVGEGSGDTSTAITIPRSIYATLLELFSLRKLEIKECCLLENVFTYSTLESLKMLEELKIERCMAMQVIVKVELGEHKVASKHVVFGRLKSICLVDLPNLKGFFLGKNDFEWPLLDYVKIYGCPEMTTFTSGKSWTPKLKYIRTGLGKHSLECGLNFDWTSRRHEINHWKRMVEDGFIDGDAPSNHSNSSGRSTSDIIKLLQFPWSFSNLIELHALGYSSSKLFGKKIFPCMEFHGQKNLEKSYATEEADEIVEETDDDFMHTQSHMKISHQKEVTMVEPNQAKRLCKSDWCPALMDLSNLTIVSIMGVKGLEHMFCYCMVGSLEQLQVLHIRTCKNMEVIVKQVQDSETKTKDEVVFPRLKSLKLFGLKSLKGFYLGREAFHWPSLVTLEIISCPKITVFTNGQSTSPNLKVIETSFGSSKIAEDINSFVSTNRYEFTDAMDYYRLMSKIRELRFEGTK